MPLSGHSIFEGEVEVYEDPNRERHRVVVPLPTPPPPPVGRLESLRHDASMAEQLKALADDPLAVSFLQALARREGGEGEIADAAAVGGLRGFVYSRLTGRRLSSVSTVSDRFATLGRGP